MGIPSGPRVRALVMVIGLSLLVFGGASPSAAAGPGVATIAVGGYHACAVRTDSTVWCWGDAGYGQLGDGTTGDANQMRSTPVRVRRGSSALRGVTTVTAGTASSCAVRVDRTVWCWGDASEGQLGNGQSGSGQQRTKAVQVRRGSGHLTGVKQLASSGNHVCALRTNGSVMCWGRGAIGQLGDGQTGPMHRRTSAVRVRQGSGYLEHVVSIAAGYDHSCAVKADGSAWCWGDGQYGQLGDGTVGSGHFRSKATKVRQGSGYLTKASVVAAGGYHTCVRRTDGSAWCWGSAGSGQLGDDTAGEPPTQTRSKPVRVLRGSGQLSGVTGIAAGGYHSCARRSDGSAFCWGSASEGQ